MSCSILCCSSNPLSHNLCFSHSPKRLTSRFILSFHSSTFKLPLAYYLHKQQPKIQSTATQELVETSSLLSRFVETGYIYGVHGFNGEVRVKTNTDFPELRFSTPGIRWLKQQNSGAETVKEIELVEGRGHPGQSWLVKFNGIDTVEQARELVGSAILVKDEDRPVLEEGEFYTNDLIGMSVVLKESGEVVGTVASVFNSGASDLLRVKLKSSKTTIDNQTGQLEQEVSDSGPLAWVPFVEAIVPIVDLVKRELLITPPKGLLELNIRAHEKSKKERRELEWKEKKKIQRRLIAAKKKLIEMEQQHVFDGFKYGEKEQRDFLANQIVTVNSKLLQQALQYISTPYARHNLIQILSAVPKSNTSKLPDYPISASNGVRSPYYQLKREGQGLTSNGKVAIFLVLQDVEKINQRSNSNLSDSSQNENLYDLVKGLFNDHQRFVQMEDRASVPLVLICSAYSLSSLQELFSDYDYFGFNREKVWLLEEEKLPVVTSSSGRHKILMKSTWEFLQKRVGSGGVISLLSSGDMLDKLNEMGVEYIEVCSILPKYENGSMLTGLVHSRKSDVGIQLFRGNDVESDFDVIFSMTFMKWWVKQINKLKFEAVLSSYSYVEKVDKDWVDVIPSDSELNSYEFQCSIYNFLDYVPIHKVSVLDSI